MSGGSFLWKDVTVPFRAGESIAWKMVGGSANVG